MFRSLMTFIREIYLDPTRVIFTLEHSSKLRRYIQIIHKKKCTVSKVNKKFISYLTQGTTYTVSSGNCPSFSCATSSSVPVLTAGPRGQFSRWRRSRKRLSLCVCDCRVTQGAHIEGLLLTHEKLRQLSLLTVYTVPV